MGLASMIYGNRPALSKTNYIHYLSILCTHVEYALQCPLMVTFCSLLGRCRYPCQSLGELLILFHVAHYYL